MTGRRRAGSDTAPSMFPFLAVLICTMGALIVLLVVVVQQARVSAQTVQQVGDSRQSEVVDDSTSKMLESCRQQSGIVEQSLHNKKQELTQQRLRLSGLEDHARRLREELQDLQVKRAAVEQPQTNLEIHLAVIREERNRIQNEVQTAIELLRKTESEFAGGNRSYALIPYEGPNGTQRRPIYVECLYDRVVIQPEKIELTQDDFRQPLGSGNALASALRAIREHWARYDTAGDQGEPYPLLIVRPGGAKSYSAARQAMAAWDSEFGYELIDKDLKLQFPDPDLELSKVLQQVVEEARRRQQRLAKTAPSRLRTGGSHGFVATRENGFVPIGGRRDSDEPLFGKSSSHPGETASKTSSGVGAAEENDGASSTYELADQSPVNANDFQTSGPAEGAIAELGNPNSPAGDRGKNQSAAQGSAPAGQSSSVTTGQAKSASSPPLAKQRGAHWALRSKRGVGFVRPIRIACHANYIVIFPESGTRDVPRTIDSLENQSNWIDRLVEALTERTQSWGIAGENSYWKPTLEVEVGPTGFERFCQLKRLLKGSGIEVTGGNS